MAGIDENAAALEIDAGCSRAHKIRTVEAGTKRAADVRRLQAAAGDFGQHGREQERVAFADESETDTEIGAELALQALSGGHSGETTAEDHDLRLFDFNRTVDELRPEDIISKIVERLCDHSDT